MSAKKIEWRGESHTYSEWAKILGMNDAALRQRIDNGWSVEKAFTTKLDGTRRKRRDHHVAGCNEDCFNCISIDCVRNRGTWKGELSTSADKYMPPANAKEVGYFEKTYHCNCMEKGIAI